MADLMTYVHRRPVAEAREIRTEFGWFTVTASDLTTVTVEDSGETSRIPLGRILEAR